MRRIVILLGPPGAGKGTVARLLVESFAFHWLSSGSLLREHKQSGSPLGKEIAGYIDAGTLVPDDLITGLIESNLTQLREDCCLMLDGFPRTLPQARSLDQILSGNHGEVSVVVEIEVDEQEIGRRIMKRSDREGRSDDTMATLKHRLEQFRRQTVPLADFYAQQDKLRVVDGMGTREEVADRVSLCIRQVLQIDPINRQKEAS